MGTESVLFVAKTKKERRMANKIDYNWVYDDKDDSFVILLSDGEYANRPVKIHNWNIDDENGHLTYDMLFSKTEDEEKMKTDEKFAEKIEQAFVEIILKAQIEAENQQQYLALLEATFRTELLKHGLEPEDGKLALDYSLELDYKVDLDKDGKLVAVDLQSKEPVDISAVIAAILVKHPTNKLILQ